MHFRLMNPPPPAQPKDSALLDQMNEFMGRVVQHHGGQRYTCFLCRRVLNVPRHALKNHFLHKHFKINFNC